MPHHVYVKRMSASRKAAVGATVAALLLAVLAGWALTAGRQLREGFASLRQELSAAASAASEAGARLAAEREASVPYGALPAAKARPREREEALREAAAALKASLE
jgi:hypothetical protein